MLRTKLVLKRLTASDLTLFEWHFRNNNAGNQKAINLNKDVFIDQLYPALPEAAADHEGRLPLDLRIYGPDCKPELNLQRKIVKFGTYKNWRLNGEFIHNPTNDANRFNDLIPNDLVILEFSGAVIPTSARMILIGEKYKNDNVLHHLLDEFLGPQKMLALEHAELSALLANVGTLENHPIYSLLLDEALEDAAKGGTKGKEKLWSGVGKQKISPDALQKARRNAEDIGYLGEEFINSFLSAKLNAGKIESMEWVSSINAVAPFDFKISENKKSILLDVKSTSGDFKRDLHISMNEIRQMANGEERYDIYRVYLIDNSAAKVKIAEDLRPFARKIIDGLSALPKGVAPNSFSVNPEILPFSKEINIEIAETDEE